MVTQNQQRHMTHAELLLALRELDCERKLRQGPDYGREALPSCGCAQMMRARGAWMHKFVTSL